VPSISVPGLRLNYAKSLFAPVLITLVLLAGHLSFGILDSYGRLLTAVGTAIVAELVFCRIFRGYWRNISSAYTSGISVGILIRSPFYWPYVLASLLTISSKYILTYRGRHIWNPSNFGVCIILFFGSFGASVLSVQWGNNLWAMIVIWIIGSYSIYQIKRFHICATYVASFVTFSWVRSLVLDSPFLVEVAPLTGPMYQLFVFFMITDPKTTVSAKWGQYAVPFAIALVGMFLRFGKFIYAPFYALFIVGPIAMLIELYSEEIRRVLQPVGMSTR
jgi:hypothetical protein